MTKEDLGVIIATRNSRMGVAMSQLSMGHWTPEFYKERCKKYEDEFKSSLREYYDNA